MAKRIFIDPRAVVETDKIGADTKIWEFTHILPGAKIGRRCNINSHVFIEDDVVVGDGVTVKCGVYLWNGIRLGDGVFVGPNATFTNDRAPRSKKKFRLLRTLVGKGATIGAGAVIGPGIKIGRFAMVGMGAVVTKDVADHSVVFGNPARERGLACFCGTAVRAVPRRCAHG